MSRLICHFYDLSYSVFIRILFVIESIHCVIVVFSYRCFTVLYTTLLTSIVFTTRCYA